jgi:hypothetical protein
LSGHGGGGKLSDRPQNSQSVPESDTELFEMLIGQVGENGEINSVLDKALGVLGHAEFFEPLRYWLHGGHQRSHRGMTEFSTTAAESLYLNLRTVERKGPQITKRNRLRNLDFFASCDTERLKYHQK